MQSKGKYSVIYSTRIDPRVIATLARGFEVRKKKFRTASGLMNDALTDHAEVLALLIESEMGEDIRFEDSFEALAYLTNDIRLETKQVRDVAQVKDKVPYQKEMIKISEQERVRAAIALGTQAEEDPSILPLAQELEETGRVIREKIRKEKEGESTK